MSTVHRKKAEAMLVRKAYLETVTTPSASNQPKLLGSTNRLLHIFLNGNLNHNSVSWRLVGLPSLVLRTRWADNLGAGRELLCKLRECSRADSIVGLILLQARAVAQKPEGESGKCVDIAEDSHFLGCVAR